MHIFRRKLVPQKVLGVTFEFPSKWTHRIKRLLIEHCVPMLLLCVVLLVSLKLNNITYATNMDYLSIPVNRVLDFVVERTVPNLKKFKDEPVCDYKTIIAENRFVYPDSNQNEWFNSKGIRFGGEFIPSDCNPAYSTAIIISYRKRKNHLKTFINYIHNFLRQQKIHYRIYVVEQVDNKPFNRAKLLNVGALYAMKEKFPCLVFHDVDMFPLNLGNLYACTTHPRHMTVNIDEFRFHLPRTNILGGAVSMQTETFKSINGMANVVS